MELILWRHAEAEDSNPGGDAERNLTKRGRRQAERMAKWLRPRMEGEWTVICSPANRAVQTVEPLGLPFEVRPGLGTAGDVSSLLREAGWPGADRVVVVGHQPTLGEAVARLFGVEGDVAVRKGAIWWFATRNREGRDKTVLRTVIDPDVLEAP